MTMQIDDSVLQAKLDTIILKLDQLIDATKVLGPIGIPATTWKTIYQDDFATCPLGELPSVWQAGIPWVGANQPGCSTQVVLLNGKKVLKVSVTNAYHHSQGARAFYHPFNPRWAELQAYEDERVRVTYSQMLNGPLQLEDGAQLWTTFGLEIKDHDGPAAVAVDLVNEANGVCYALQHWTDIAHAEQPKPVLWSQWANAELLLNLSRKAEGSAELRLGDGTRVKSLGANMNPADAGGGLALCLYGNNILGGTATGYFSDFRIEVAV